ncbi:hypothetical protein C8Q73DRAFT_705056 [Cubamyces lactineus]|nr:hypothetical protein C8Q73DRAFT_705056 [Cubamyces lactineus]
MAEVRVALVTGAAQGIGKAIAMRLADDGLDIALNDLPQKLEQVQAIVDAIRTKGRRALAVCGDASNEEEVVDMIKTTVGELGGLDVMVANAGILVSFATIADTPVESWEKIMSVNARSVFLAIKHAARQMIAQGRGGRIIAASSVAGKQGMQNVGAYCASKFAVRGLAQCAAVELRAHNISVNCYCPGTILTDMSISKSYKVLPRKVAPGKDGIPGQAGEALAFPCLELPRFAWPGDHLLRVRHTGRSIARIRPVRA